MENTTFPENAPSQGVYPSSEHRKSFIDSLYVIVERIAHEKIWFLAGVFLSTLAIQILLAVIETLVFGPPASKNAPDPNAFPRFIVSSIGNAYSLLITLGMVGVVYAWLHGQEARMKELFNVSFFTWLKGLATIILFFVGTVIGFILLIIPGIWFALTYQFAVIAIATHPEQGIMNAFRKSKEITQNRKWMILVTSIVLSFRFWWRKGGKWAALGIVGTLILLTLSYALKAAVPGSAPGILVTILQWASYIVGAVSIVAFIVTGIYSSIVLQFVNMPLIFFSLSNEQPAQASADTISGPAPDTNNSTAYTETAPSPALDTPPTDTPRNNA